MSMRLRGRGLGINWPHPQDSFSFSERRNSLWCMCAKWAIIIVIWTEATLVVSSHVFQVRGVFYGHVTLPNIDGSLGPYIPRACIYYIDVYTSYCSEVCDDLNVRRIRLYIPEVLQLPFFCQA